MGEWLVQMSERSVGYCFQDCGQRLYDSCPRNRGQNISLIGALSLDGLIATMSIPASVNTDVFLTYVKSVLAPQLWVGALVIMDKT